MQDETDDDHNDTPVEPILPPDHHHHHHHYYPSEADGVRRAAHAVEREAYAVEREARALERETLNWLGTPAWSRWHTFHELSTLSAALDRAFVRAQRISTDMPAGEALLALQRSAADLHKRIDQFLATQWPNAAQPPAADDEED